MINSAPKFTAAVDRGQCGLSTCGRQAVATAAAVNLIKGLWLRRNDVLDTLRSTQRKAIVNTRDVPRVTDPYRANHQDAHRFSERIKEAWSRLVIDLKF